MITVFPRELQIADVVLKAYNISLMPMLYNDGFIKSASVCDGIGMDVPLTVMLDGSCMASSQWQCLGMSPEFCGTSCLTKWLPRM